MGMLHICLFHNVQATAGWILEAIHGLLMILIKACAHFFPKVSVYMIATCAYSIQQERNGPVVGKWDLGKIRIRQFLVLPKKLLVLLWADHLTFLLFGSPPVIWIMFLYFLKSQNHWGGKEPHDFVSPSTPKKVKEWFAHLLCSQYIFSSWLFI